MHNKSRRSTAAAIGIRALLAISVLMLSACSGGGSSATSSSGTGSSGGSSLSSGGGGSGSSTIPWTNLLFAYGMPQELVWNGTGYVGANGTMTSQSPEYGYQIATNPQVWSLTDPISSYAASALGWNGSLYVALGTAWFDTSPDGKTWTSRTFNTTALNSFNAIAWSGSMWVAVGTGGAIVYSSDGITWTQTTLNGVTSTLDAVTWTGTQFVAAGTGGVLATSSDGISWTVQPAPVSSTTDIIGLASANKLIVAVANSETSPATTSILTSPDGASFTWTTVQPSLSFVPNSIGYIGNQWIAVGDYYSMTSPDGTTWATSPVLNGILYSVVYNGTEYVATGMDVNSVGAEYTSPDGLKWTEVNQVGSLTAAAISPTGNSIVAVGPTNTTRASSDGGATWSLGGLGTANYPFDDVTWSPALNEFIALVQEPLNAYLYESSDGVTWTSLGVTNCGAGTVISSPAIGSSPATIVDAGTNYGGGGCVYTSTDGINWALGSAPWATQSVTKGYWTGSEFLVVGTSGLIATSTTGAAWTPETTGTTQNLNGAAVSPNTMVVVGDSGTILTSNDNGSTWTPQTSGTTSNLNRVVWTGTQFYAVGDTSTLLSSPDGVTWTTLTTPFNNWPSTYPSNPPTEPNFNDAIWAPSIAKLIIFGDNGLVATTP